MPPRKSSKPKLPAGKKRSPPDSPAKNTRSTSNEFHAEETRFLSPIKLPRKRRSPDNSGVADQAKAAPKPRSKSASPLKRATRVCTDVDIISEGDDPISSDPRYVKVPGIDGVTNFWPPTTLRTSPFDSPGRRLGSFDASRRPTSFQEPSVQKLREASKSPNKSVHRHSDATDPFQPGSLSVKHQKLLVHLGGRDRYHQSPKIMSLGEISECYQALQGVTHIYANQYFAFELSAEQQANWPLHRLRTHYPTFFLCAQYLFDGGEAGWREFFTQPYHRKYFVTAIISEWITQRIFKHTAFGINEEDIHELEDIDREYIHYDAVVRSKKKSEILTKMLFKSEACRRTHVESIKRSVDTLAEELVTVLNPLLPLCRQGQTHHDDDADTRIEEQSSIRHFHKVHIRDSILIQAANLALSIRISSRDGTVIRTVPPIPIGSKYSGSASMICVNAEDCVNISPEYRKGKTLCVKMNCWPRIEAIQPHGPDVNELEILEADARAETKLQSKDSSNNSRPFSWHGYDNVWPELPEDLNHMVEDDTSEVSDSESADDEKTAHGGSKRKASHDKAAGPPTKKLKRAAYMTIYPRICCATVYCEWIPNDLSISNRQTLAEAVAEARSQWSPLLRVEDQYINLRNHFATFSGGYQWLLLAAFIYGMTQHGPITLTKQLLNSATRTLLNPFSLILRWNLTDHIHIPLEKNIKEAFLTHILGASANPTPGGNTESIHPSILLRALQPYIAPRSQLRNMTGSELAAHLSYATKQCLQETLKPFRQVSFSVPDAMKEIYGRGKEAYNGAKRGFRGSSRRSNGPSWTTGPSTTITARTVQFTEQNTRRRRNR